MFTLDLRPNDLLVCIDETGSETLRDPRHPVFGFGGCAVTGSSYQEAVEGPWSALKKEHFGNLTSPLHAVEISKHDRDGIAAICSFFRTSPIARFATVITTDTTITGDDTERFQAVSLPFIDQIGRVLQAFEYYRLVLAFEESQRGNRLVRRHFSTLQPILAGPDGPFRGPVERCFIPKTLAFPPMEIADCVAYAAGVQGREQMAPRFDLRADFRAIFEPCPGRFAEVHFATGIHVSRREHGG